MHVAAWSLEADAQYLYTQSISAVFRQQLSLVFFEVKTRLQRSASANNRQLHVVSIFQIISKSKPQKQFPRVYRTPATRCYALDLIHGTCTWHFLLEVGILQQRIVSVANFAESSKCCQFTLLCTFAKSRQYARELHTTLKPNRGCRGRHPWSHMPNSTLNT